MSFILANATNISLILDPLLNFGPMPKPIIDNELYITLMNVIACFVFGFGLMGVITNSINVRVFIHQGLNDSNTVGLFSLAIADLFGCLFGIPGSICQVLYYVRGPVSYIYCVTYTALAGTLPHLILSRITVWITVYIAVERSLCVLIPFKVKRLLQKSTASIAMCLIYTIIIGSYLPVISFYRVVWVFNPFLNDSIPLYSSLSKGDAVVKYTSLVYNTILTATAFAIITIATILLVYKLNASSKWRKASSGVKSTSASKDKSYEDSAGGDSSDKKDKAAKAKDLEVIKMVVLITGLFLICVSMSQIPGLVLLQFEGVNSNGLNKNLYNIVYCFKMMSDLVNSSLNYFFYVRVSTRYKQAHAQVFQWRKDLAK